MDMPKVTFTQLLSSQFNSQPVQAGNIYFVRDTNEIWVDMIDDVDSETVERRRYSVSSLEDLANLATLNTTTIEGALTSESVGVVDSTAPRVVLDTAAEPSTVDGQLFDQINQLNWAADVIED